MTEELQSDPVPGDPAENPAIARCCLAFSRARRASLARNKSSVCANLDGYDAYCKAMPPLSSLDNIRDFISCVGHGMCIQAISGTHGARLLYAARVAYSAAARPPARQKTAA